MKLLGNLETRVKIWGVATSHNLQDVKVQKSTNKITKVLEFFKAFSLVISFDQKFTLIETPATVGQLDLVFPYLTDPV